MTPVEPEPVTPVEPEPVTPVEPEPEPVTPVEPVQPVQPVQPPRRLGGRSDARSPTAEERELLEAETLRTSI